MGAWGTPTFPQGLAAPETRALGSSQRAHGAAEPKRFEPKAPWSPCAATVFVEPAVHEAGPWEPGSRRELSGRLSWSRPADSRRWGDRQPADAPSQGHGDCRVDGVSGGAEGGPPEGGVGESRDMSAEAPAGTGEPAVTRPRGGGDSQPGPRRAEGGAHGTDGVQLCAVRGQGWPRGLGPVQWGESACRSWPGQSRHGGRQELGCKRALRWR